MDVRWLYLLMHAIKADIVSTINAILTVISKTFDTSWLWSHFATTGGRHLYPMGFRGVGTWRTLHRRSHARHDLHRERPGLGRQLRMGSQHEWDVCRPLPTRALRRWTRRPGPKRPRSVGEMVLLAAATRRCHGADQRHHVALLRPASVVHVGLHLLRAEDEESVSEAIRSEILHQDEALQLDPANRKHGVPPDPSRSDPLDVRCAGPGRVRGKLPRVGHHVANVRPDVGVSEPRHGFWLAISRWHREDQQQGSVPLGTSRTHPQVPRLRFLLGRDLHILVPPDGKHARPRLWLHPHLAVHASGESDVHPGPSQQVLASPPWSLGHPPRILGSLADRRTFSGRHCTLPNVPIRLPLALHHDATLRPACLEVPPQMDLLPAVHRLHGGRDLHLRLGLRR